MHLLIKTQEYHVNQHMVGLVCVGWSVGLGGYSFSRRVPPNPFILPTNTTTKPTITNQKTSPSINGGLPRWCCLLVCLLVDISQPGLEQRPSEKCNTNTTSIQFVDQHWIGEVLVLYLSGLSFPLTIVKGKDSSA